MYSCLFTGSGNIHPLFFADGKFAVGNLKLDRCVFIWVMGSFKVLPISSRVLTQTEPIIEKEE